MNTAYRNELKYVIDPGTASIISSRMAMCCSFDQNADEQGFYRVSSLYFDDFCNSALNDNMVGQSDRKKYRIRIYNGGNDYIRLEKKIKHNKGGKKESYPLTLEQYKMILAEDYDALKETSDNVLLSGFCLEAIMRGLRPRVIVDYNRKSFVYEYGDVRITMDHEIKHSAGSNDLFDEDQIFAPAVEQNEIVLEVKYTGFLPGIIKNLVQQSVAPQTGFSKYTLSRTCFR